SGAALWRAQSDGTLKLDLTAGALAERESLARALEPLADAVARERSALLLEHPDRDDSLSPESARRFARVACVPMLGAESVRGVRALCDPEGVASSAFEPADHALSGAMAERIAELLERAERWDALRQAETQLAELRARLRRRERLATLGEIAARIAREA